MEEKKINQPARQVLSVAACHLHVRLTDQTPYSMVILNTLFLEVGTFRLWMVQLGEELNTCYVAQLCRAGEEVYLAS